MIKRVYKPEEKNDGYRVLVDKLWPRGFSKASLHCELWAKDIAPSTPLRQWYHQNKSEHWDEFSMRYIKELENSSAVEEFINSIRGKQIVTLLYASGNAAENHALVLRDFLERKLSE